MTSVILAGGLGTRLRPILPNRPKVLAEVSGRPFLSYIFEQLISAGVRKVVLCTGHRAQMILELFGSTYKSLDLKYSTEDRPLGTAGALRLALPYLSSEYVLVMNGDSFVDTQLGTYGQWFFEQERRGALLLTEVLDTGRYGRVSFSASGQILSFDEKKVSSGPGWINAGIYIFSTSLLEDIPEGKFASLESEFLPQWIGGGLYGYPCRASFIDIGVPDSYAFADRFFGSITEKPPKNKTDSSSAPKARPASGKPDGNRSANNTFQRK